MKLRKDLIGRHHADGMRRSKHVAFACSLTIGSIDTSLGVWLLQVGGMLCDELNATENQI